MLIFLICAILALVLLPGTMDLILVTAGALFPRKNGDGFSGEGIHAVAVVPAHNEENSIASCIDSLQQVEGDLHIVVVAHNCDDQTAVIARSKGVEVLERFSEKEVGKPYALTYAFNHLLARDYEWFIVVDADTSIDKNFLKRISSTIDKYGSKALQGRYSIRNAAETMRTRLMKIAFYSQYLRMRGKDRLGLSTGIQGNGFVLHREIVEKIPLRVEYITEDLAYYLELLLKGYHVKYCEDAHVSADMPLTQEGVKSQRSRWEGGRFRVAVDYIPKLFKRLLRGDVYCLEPLLDLLLLPLGYHLLGIFLLLIFSGFSLFSWLYVFVPTAHVLLSVWLGGGTLRDLMVLAAVPYYIFWKVVNLGSTLKFSKKETSWVRTDRGKHTK